MLEKMKSLWAKELQWRKRYEKYHADVVAYVMDVQKRFAAYNTVIFFAYALIVWLFDKYWWNEGTKGYIYCLGMGGFALLNFLLQKFVMPNHPNGVVKLGNIYILIWGKALLSINLVVQDSSISWTLLLCAFVMTSMLSIVPTHYLAIVAIIFGADMTEFIITNHSLIPSLYNLIDDIVIMVVCLATNMLLSKRRFESFERREMLLGESTRDPLTNLYNRRHLERFYVRTSNANELCALILLDLDNFKMANDVFGHKMGDEVLCKVGDILRHCFRESDCVARLGGDEFAVFLPKIPSEQLVIQRVWTVLNQFPIVLEEEKRVEVSVSIGIACKQAGEYIPYEKLCDKADVAMYTAKRAGKAKAVLAADKKGKDSVVITAKSSIS